MTLIFVPAHTRASVRMVKKKTKQHDEKKKRGEVVSLIRQKLQILESCISPSSVIANQGFLTYHSTSIFNVMNSVGFLLLDSPCSLSQVCSPRMALHALFIFVYTNLIRADFTSLFFLYSRDGSKPFIGTINDVTIDEKYHERGPTKIPDEDNEFSIIHPIKSNESNRYSIKIGDDAVRGCLNWLGPG